VQRRVSTSELADSIGEPSKILGKKERSVTTVSPIDDASDESVSFCIRKAEEGLQMVRGSKAPVIICREDLPLTEDDLKDKTFLLVSDPRSAFIRVMKRYFLEEKIDFGISATAVIEKGAEIHQSVYIGPHCHIGRCKIGRGTVIYGNTYIHSNTQIGSSVIINTGAIIGGEASGLARNAKGELERFPQIGGVIIEDDVEIGSNTSITRGAMGNTIIGRGTKIGDLCYIGHGALIGKHCLILSHSALGGYIRIGDYSQVSLGACVRNTVEIGKNALVGMGAVVTKNVGDGKVVFGVPAREQGKAQE
jgi:UDP-3-O-[3-hydroxymyristoyl] glucosamine N-acyltransferase